MSHSEPTRVTLPTSLQDPLPLLDDTMCELPPIMDDFDPHSLQPILTPPQPMDFFDSEYHGQQTPQQQQQLWQQGRQQRPRRQRQRLEQELPQEQQQQQRLKTSVVASKQTPSSAAAPAHTITSTSSTVDRSSRSRSLSLDVNHGHVVDVVNPDGDDDGGVLGMSVVKRMESLEHEYKRVKRELLRGDGGVGDNGYSEDPDQLQEGEEAESEALCSPHFGPDIPRRCPRNECPSTLRYSHDSPVVVTHRRRSTDKFLSIFGSDGDSHLNEGEDELSGRFMFFAAASSPCGGGGDGKAFEDCPPHPTKTTKTATATKSSTTTSSQLRNDTSKTVVVDNDDDEVARPLHDLADQLVELRLSLQRAEVGSGGRQRSVYTIPEEEGESGEGRISVGPSGEEGKEGFGRHLGEDGRDSGPADLEMLLHCRNAE